MPRPGSNGLSTWFLKNISPATIFNLGTDKKQSLLRVSRRSFSVNLSVPVLFCQDICCIRREYCENEDSESLVRWQPDTVATCHCGVALGHFRSLVSMSYFHLQRVTFVWCLLSCYQLSLIRFSLSIFHCILYQLYQVLFLYPRLPLLPCPTLTLLLPGLLKSNKKRNECEG